MKILVIGDFHGVFPSKLKNKAKECDLILCTGDLGGSNKLLKIIFKYLGKKWWEIVGIKKAKEYILEDYNSGKKILKELSSLKKPVYLISGNWDFTSRRNLERTLGIKFKMLPELVKEIKNINYWKRGLKKIKGLNILAFGGMVTSKDYTTKNGFYKNNPKKLKLKIKESQQEKKQIMSYGKKNLDVLFAHYPPFGYFDVVKSIKTNPMNGKHIGFEGYNDYIKKYSPNIFVCGHMHEYQGKKKLGKTTVIATGGAKDGKAVIIDYNLDTQKFKINFIK